MIIGTTVEDCYDFVNFIRSQQKMQDQILEWSDEDLEAFYLYMGDCWGPDEVVDEMYIWDMLRFEFVVYKAGSSNLYLDWDDFLSDYKDELIESTDKTIAEITIDFLSRDKRADIIDMLNSDIGAVIMAANGDIIVGHN